MGAGFLSRRINPRFVFAGALLAIFAFAGGVAAGLQSDRDKPVRRPDSRSPFAGALMPVGVTVPPFSLRDQDGASASSKDLRGRVAIVTFVYSACDESCGPQIQLIRGALNRLDYDIPALAITADPRNDTPESARKFLLDQRVPGQVRFLLGTPAELAPVYRGFFIQPQTDNGDHSARIVLLDRRGRQRVGYSMLDTTVADIVHDINVLEREPD